MGKEKDFSVFIKSEYVLFPVLCYRLKAFGKKWENKTYGKISHSTVYNQNSVSCLMCYA